MHAMQYTIPLPADYDMQIIRDRVTRTGQLFDGFSGLIPHSPVHVAPGAHASLIPLSIRQHPKRWRAGVRD